MTILFFLQEVFWHHHVKLTWLAIVQLSEYSIYSEQTSLQACVLFCFFLRSCIPWRAKRGGTPLFLHPTLSHTQTQPNTHSSTYNRNRKLSYCTGHWKEILETVPLPSQCVLASVYMCESNCVPKAITKPSHIHTYYTIIRLTLPYKCKIFIWLMC